MVDRSLIFKTKQVEPIIIIIIGGGINITAVAILIEVTNLCDDVL